MTIRTSNRQTRFPGAIAEQVVLYDQYRDLSVRVRPLANKHSHHGLTDWQPAPTGYRPKR